MNELGPHVEDNVPAGPPDIESINSDEEDLFPSDVEDEDLQLPTEIVISDGGLAADDTTMVSTDELAKSLRGGMDMGAVDGGGDDPADAELAPAWPADFPPNSHERVAASCFMNGWPYITLPVACALVREGLVLDDEMRRLQTDDIDAIIRNLNRTYNLQVGHKLKTDLIKLCFAHNIYYMTHSDRLTMLPSAAMTAPYDMLQPVYHNKDGRPLYVPGTTAVPRYEGEKKGSKPARRVLKDIELLCDQLHFAVDGGARAPLSVVLRADLIPATTSAGRRGPSTADVHHEVVSRFPAFHRPLIARNVVEFQGKTEAELAGMIDETHFKEANRIVYAILGEAFRDTAMWAQVEGACDKTRNGRLAWLLLMKVAMGKEYFTREKDDITKLLLNNVFRGTLERWTITNYNAKAMALFHRSRNLATESAGKVSCMTASEEVDAYFRGITCPALDTMKPIIMSNSSKRDSVEACMEDVTEAVRTLGRKADAASRAGSQRHIQMIRGGGGRPRGQGRDRVQGRDRAVTWDEAAVGSQMADLKRRYFNAEHKGFIPSDVYKALDANGHQAVYRLRKTAGEKKGSQNDAGRTIKALQSQIDAQAVEIAALKKGADDMDVDENDNTRGNPTGGGRNPRRPK